MDTDGPLAKALELGATLELDGVPYAELAPPAPASSATAARPNAAWALSLGGRVGGMLLDRAREGARFGGLAALSLPARLSPSFALEGGYMLPVTIDRSGVQADFALASGRAHVRIEPDRGRRVGFEAAVTGPRQGGHEPPLQRDGAPARAREQAHSTHSWVACWALASACRRGSA